jgi:REP element-mobilizing transposase RayT
MYQPRIEAPGAYYHVATRGNSKVEIFFADRERQMFLLIFARIARKYGWHVAAYCLMDNHYHFILQLSDRGLSKGMCELNTRYSTWFNVEHGRSNHLFGKRFWSDQIGGDEHLLEACRYVVLNRVRAGLCDDPGDWPWSSYLASAGAVHGPAFLVDRDVIGFFANDPERGRAAWKSYVREGRGQRQPPWESAPT